MDGEFRANIEEILRSIETAEVISFYFPRLRKTLLVDTRTTDDDPPMVRLVAMATSPEARFRSLRRLRPHLPKPQAITLIPWPRYVESLVTLGVWDRLLKRLSHAGHPEVIRACEAILDELRRREQEEAVEAIRGDYYRTLWARSR